MIVPIIKSCGRFNFGIFQRLHSRLSYALFLQKHQFKINGTNLKENSPRIFSRYSLLSGLLSNSPLETQRYYSKKKKSSKKQVEEEENDEEDEDFESLESEEIDSDNLKTKYLPSLRVDSIVKAGLGLTKKKVEKEFYASRIRINGQKVLKKSTLVHIEDEVDFIKGYSPENQKFLLVDRIVIKGIGKMNDKAYVPVKMEVLKELTIENYPDSWSKTDVLEND